MRRINQYFYSCFWQPVLNANPLIHNSPFSDLAIESTAFVTSRRLYRRMIPSNASRLILPSVLSIKPSKIRTPRM